MEFIGDKVSLVLEEKMKDRGRHCQKYELFGWNWGRCLNITNKTVFLHKYPIHIDFAKLMCA